MPRRITKIEVDNYRAFYGKGNVVTLPKGENLLVYGENGSGKSSLYRALRDFFAQERPDEGPTLEWHFHAKHGPEIRLAFAEFQDGKLLDGAEQTFANAEAAGVMAETDVEGSEARQLIYEANLAKGFFSYRELLKTHLSDWDEEIDLFDLLIETVLRNWAEPATGETLYEFWASIEGRAYTHTRTGAEDQNTKDYLDSIEAKAKSDLEDFHLRLEAALQLLEPEINAFIGYFQHHVEVAFDLKKFDPFDETSDGEAPQVFLKASFFGHEIEKHHQSLNEARLSALAISIFLASVKNNPADPQVLKVLFLDDIFLGLDTGNRLPLLNILNDHFQDYQIFLTTYDRAWFEVARAHLQGNWKQIEMYAEHTRIEWEDDPTLTFEFERPLIIHPSLGYLEKARLYFQKKDYPTCANYQRKWCEQFLKGYLQQNYRLEVVGDETALGITKLETLFGKLRAFYKDSGLALPAAVEQGYLRHRDTVMNPFSHDDLESPVYRQELEDGFALIEAFQQLPPLRKSTLASPDDIIEYREPSVGYICRIRIVAGPLTLIRHGKEVKIKGKGVAIEHIENETTQPLKPGALPLSIEELVKTIENYLRKKYPTALLHTDRFSALMLVSQSISLRDILNG